MREPVIDDDEPVMDGDAALSWTTFSGSGVGFRSGWQTKAAAYHKEAGRGGNAVASATVSGGLRRRLRPPRLRGRLVQTVRQVSRRASVSGGASVGLVGRLVVSRRFKRGWADPARGPASPGYVERRRADAPVCGVAGVGRSAGRELGAGTGGDDGCWSAVAVAARGPEQWSSGAQLGIDLLLGSVADRDSALYREGGIRRGSV